MVALYTILGICVLTVIGALATGKSPPEAVYGLLGTFGAYVLFGPDGKPKGDARGDPPSGDHPAEPDTASKAGE